ncbi:hypothetical protein EDD21DRAFT_439819 [Dissophora ornata]|nr:hypothetical protein EDD21DRAFT_439819 [Dissophora ornata]
MTSRSFLEPDPVCGFIFLLRPQGSRLSKAEDLNENVEIGKGYSANQVISDACGTQASPSTNAPGLEIGLAGKYERDPGIVLSSLVKRDREIETEAVDTIHYVAYVHVGDYVRELGGMQPRLLRLTRSTDQDWLKVATVGLMAKTKSYAENGEHFVLLVVIKHPMPILQERLDRIKEVQDRGIGGEDIHEGQVRAGASGGADGGGGGFPAGN